jgi:sugar lactone lactonase YvrE
MPYRNLPIIVILLMTAAACSPPKEDTGIESVSGADERTALAGDSELFQPGVVQELLDCQSSGDMTVHCGYKNPEDLVALPDGKYLVVSEMGEFMADTPGTLSLLNMLTGKREPLTVAWSQSTSKLGDETCPAPDAEAFSPHGIDLTALSDGALQLLVVNHGKRESVEFFEVIESNGVWQLSWRGCALPPGDPFINDVAGLKDGGFFVTHMWNKTTAFDEVARKLSAGESTGWVYEWQRDRGFTKVPGSDDLMPNGIAVSNDNAKIFVNIYFGGKTIKIDRGSGEIEGEFAVQQPDNITVDEDGYLWVASHKNDPIGQTCALVTAGPCLLPYDVIRADPETMQAEVFLSQDGAPMGYATVALKVGNRLFVGSAHGDRVVSSPVH